MKRYTIFYANQVWGDVEKPTAMWLHALPEGCYIYCREATGWAVGDPQWLRKDLTPVLLEDVPKELLVLKLLLT